jgi:lysine 2,3-aminomutase
MTKDAAQETAGPEESAEPPGERTVVAVAEPAASVQAASSNRVGRDSFNVASEEWTSWRWQMGHSLRTLSDFERVLNLSDEERQGLALASKKFTVAATPYFVSLMDRDDPSCPIRRQVVPSARELYVSPTDMEDPCGEEHDMKTPGLVHRYPDRVLFLASDRCAGYCRYCTRSRLVGAGDLRPVTERVEAAAQYVAAHPEVRDVLISGGDPLLSGEAVLGRIIRRFRAIPHVEIVRIGSRVPSYLPQRITPRLVRTLRSAGALYLSVHFSHPREITPEVERALATIADAGIVMGSQTVLLRVLPRASTPPPPTLKRLFQLLLKNRVRPYYLYQCDPVMGASHFRTSVAEGVEIMRRVRGFTSGYAVPTYVIDAPGGGGKTPVDQDYIVARGEREVTLRNWAGRLYTYPEV